MGIFHRLKFGVVRLLFPLVEMLSVKLAHIWSRNLFVTPVRLPQRKEEKKAADAAFIDLIPLNGKEIKVYVWGKPPYLLFVHGWVGRGTNLASFIPFLQKEKIGLIGFDAPAHGLSSGKKTNLREFIDAVEMIEQKYEILGYAGHSLGGMAAYMWKLRSGAKKPLVMIGSPSDAREIFKFFFSSINGSQKTVPMMKKWLKELTDIDVDADMTLYKLPLDDPESLMVVHDEQDPDCRVDNGRRMHTANPGSKALITSGLGHRKILGEEGVIRAVLAFLKENRGKSRQ